MYKFPGRVLALTTSHATNWAKHLYRELNNQVIIVTGDIVLNFHNTHQSIGHSVYNCIFEIIFPKIKQFYTNISVV